MPREAAPLFPFHPALRERLPRVALADLPTEVVRLRALEAEIEGASLWMKRDDLASPIYGGNKTRKLELILGALESRGETRVMTFGFAGSNHAAATALFCKERGISCVSMLMHEPPSPFVRANLLAAVGAGAKLFLYPDLARLVIGAAAYRMLHPGPRGRLLPMIAAGGSTVEGNAAYASAAFELRAQIDRGALEEPDEIYVAGGSLGTAAGLLVGLRAARLKSRLIAVRATEKRFANEKVLFALAGKTARFLERLDPSFPRIDLDGASIDDGHVGGGPGAPSKEALAAMRTLERIEGVRIEPRYTAGAFARFLDAARARSSRRKSLLFWNTCNAVDLSPLASRVGRGALPQAFGRYFENA